MSLRGIYEAWRIEREVKKAKYEKEKWLEFARYFSEYGNRKEEWKRILKRYEK